MSKRYEVKRFSSCYSLNWVDNKTNKELTAVEIEQIVNNQYQRIAELEDQLKTLTKNEKVFSNNETFDGVKVCSFVDLLNEEMEDLQLELKGEKK